MINEFNNILISVKYGFTMETKQAGEILEL